jgi:hypothetical protein
VRLSKRNYVRFSVRFAASIAVLGAAAVILAGFSAFAMRSSRALPFNGLTSSDDGAEPQMPNRALKTNRIAALLPVALTSGGPAGFTLASAPQGADLERFYSTVTSAQPMLPMQERIQEREQAATPNLEPTAYTPETRKPQTVAALPVAPDKPKRLPPPAPPAESNMLDDGAIAGLKTRLRLSTDQMEYWPAVESALREVARTQLRHTGKQMQGRKINIDTNSAEVQQLIWAAMPLLMRLRDEQKSEVRKLARIMGLEQVASQI